MTTFVCLLDVDEQNEVPPYEPVAQDIASEYGRSISVIHFPIPGKFVINEHYTFLANEVKILRSKFDYFRYESCQR